MSRNTVSFWMDDAARRELIPPAAPTLRRAIDADVVVVGGGFAGQLVRGLVDPDLDNAADERLRRALSTSRLPVGGALRLGARFLTRALTRARPRS